MYEYYGDMTGVEEFAEGMLGFSLLSNIGSILMSIAVYVFMAIGMYTIAKRRGIHHPWLAWIPFGSSWMLGCISDQYRYAAKGQEKSKRKIMLALDIATTAVGVVTIVMLFVGIFRLMGRMDGNFGALENEVISDATYVTEVLGLLMGSVGLCFVMLGLAIALAVLHYMALYDLFTSCNPANSVLFTVLSILIGGILQAIFVFVCRNKDFGMPPRQPQIYNAPPVWQPPQPPVEPWEMNNDH